MIQLESASFSKFLFYMALINLKFQNLMTETGLGFWISVIVIWLVFVIGYLKFIHCGNLNTDT